VGVVEDENGAAIESFMFTDTESPGDCGMSTGRFGEVFPDMACGGEDMTSPPLLLLMLLLFGTRVDPSSTGDEIGESSTAT